MADGPTDIGTTTGITVTYHTLGAPRGVTLKDGTEAVARDIYTHREKLGGGKLYVGGWQTTLPPIT